MRLIYVSFSDKTLLFFKHRFYGIELGAFQELHEVLLALSLVFLLAAKCFWFLSWII